MYKISITTSQPFTRENADGRMKTYKEAGFDCLDLSLDGFLSGTNIRNGVITYFDQSTEDILKDLSYIKEAADKYGLGFGQVHAPFPAMVYGRDDINEMMLDVMDKSLAIAEYFGAPWCIVHPVLAVKIAGYEEEKKFNLEMYKKLIPLAKKHHVGICLENMFDWEIRHAMQAVCSDINDANYYINTLNGIAGEEIFGFCLDVGHLALVGGNMFDAITRLGKNLKTLHLHENNTEQDLHALPYSYSCFFSQTPESMMNWPEILRGLASVGYKGTLNFEVGGAFQIYPKAVHRELFFLTAAIGRYFSDEIENYKKNGCQKLN